MRVSSGAKEMNIDIATPRDSKYELVDTWTTIDGEWYTGSSEFSVPQWAVDEYAIAGELGGAHHLFVRVLDEDGEVDFGVTVVYYNNGLQDTREIQMKDGFANLPVFNVFYPDQGENGGWQTAPVVPGNTKYLVEGGGLPHGLHVSLFTVYRPKKENGGNGNGEDHRIEVWLPANNTTIKLHTNGHDFKMEVTE